MVVAEPEARAPQQARAVERRELLLRAATRVFAERGFGRAGMDDVARAAETSKGGLYFHFPTKQALLAAVVSRAGALLQRRVRAAMEQAGDDPLARADAALSALFAGLSGRRALARVLNEALAAGRRFGRRRPRSRMSSPRCCAPSWSARWRWVGSRRSIRSWRRGPGWRWRRA